MELAYPYASLDAHQVSRLTYIADEDIIWDKSQISNKNIYFLRRIFGIMMELFVIGNT